MRSSLFFLPLLLIGVVVFIAFFFSPSISFNFTDVGSDFLIMMIVLSILFFIILVMLFKISLALIVSIFNLLFFASTFAILNYFTVVYDLLTILGLLFFFFLGAWRMIIVLQRYQKVAHSRVALRHYFWHWKIAELKSLWIYVVLLIFILPIYEVYSGSFWNLFTVSPGKAFALCGLFSFLVHWLFFYSVLILGFNIHDLASKKILSFQHPHSPLFSFLYRYHPHWRNWTSPKNQRYTLVFFILLVLVLLVWIIFWIYSPSAIYQNNFHSVWLKSVPDNLAGIPELGITKEQLVLFRSNLNEIATFETQGFFVSGNNISGQKPLDLIIVFAKPLLGWEKDILQNSGWIVQTNTNYLAIYGYLFKTTLLQIVFASLLPAGYFLLRYGGKAFMIYVFSWIFKLLFAFFVFWFAGIGFYLDMFVIIIILFIVDLLRLDWKMQRLNQENLYETQKNDYLQRWLLSYGQFATLLIAILLSNFPLSIAFGLLSYWCLIQPIMNFYETFSWNKLKFWDNSLRGKLLSLYQNMSFPHGKESEVPGLND